MKVLSLKEPFASLIKENKKKIETRSWKTNYRGTLYIHASISKIDKSISTKKELLKLITNMNMNYGYIVCKCNLVDCIYMTKEYIDKIKKDNYEEYICGEYKVGRYAWILEDITPIKPLKAKGNLNIWNYYNEEEIMSLMNNINYGWVDKEENIHSDVDNNFASTYILQSPKEVLNSKVGVCWDQVELERYYFANTGLNIKTYFIVYYDNKNYPTHTFLTYEKDNLYYWFEHSWELFKGIHEYKSLEELLLDAKNKFIKYELNNNCNKDNLFIYEYSKPKYHLTTDEFYEYCSSRRSVN